MRRQRLFLEEARVREDRRVIDSRKQEEEGRKKIAPYMESVCSLYRVTRDDVTSSANRHPEVVRARDVVTYLAWERCRISPGVIAKILRKDRSETSKRITRVRHRVADDAQFAMEVARVVSQAVVQ